MQITQVFISDDGKGMSRIIKRNIEIIKELYPNHIYHLYNNESIEEFLL